MKIDIIRVAFAVAVGSWLAIASLQAAHAHAGNVSGLPAQASAEQQLPDAPGRAVVARVCTQCHGIEYVVPSERTVPVWRDTLELMRAYGAEASDEDWTTITQYIGANLAHLDVNKAPAEDFGLVFGVDEKVAQDVVAYREKQGGFKTIEDLKNAPGLDAQKVETLKGRLIFG